MMKMMEEEMEENNTTINQWRTKYNNLLVAKEELEEEIMEEMEEEIM